METGQAGPSMILVDSFDPTLQTALALLTSKISMG